MTVESGEGGYRGWFAYPIARRAEILPRHRTRKRYRKAMIPAGLSSWRKRRRLLEGAPRRYVVGRSAGEIQAVRPLPAGPLVLKRADLDEDAAQRLSQRVERHRRHSGRRGTGDETLDLFSETSESRGGAL